MRTLVTAGVLSALMGGMSWPALGATIRVPEDHPTILAGMDAAAPGDTVLVGPGTWTEAETRLVWIEGSPWEIRSLCFAKEGTVLRSTSGAGQTTLDLQGTGFFSTGVLVEPLDAPVTIEGFSFIGRTQDIVVGSCVTNLSSAGVVVRDCRFEGNSAPVVAVAAIETGGPAVIERCEFRDNDASGGLGVIYSITSDVTITDSLFEGNAGDVVYSQGTPSDPSRTLIENTAFDGNTRLCVVAFVHELEVRNCFFDRHAEASVLSGSLDTLLEGCTFAADPSDPNTAGSGVVLSEYHGEIRECTFVRGGEAVGVAGDASATVERCVFAYLEGSEALSGVDGNVTSDCNVFWQNAGGDFDDVVPGPHDLPADPEFCDLENLDLTVRSTSPCAPENSGPCGQIGAWGVGCGPVSVESRSWGAIKGLYR